MSNYSVDPDELYELSESALKVFQDLIVFADMTEEMFRLMHEIKIALAHR